MSNSVWYSHFLRALYEKYPKKAQLTEALMDLLSIEREAIYRRLRKEVVFSAGDIAKIASAWNISLDNILSTVSEKNSSFQMNALSFNDSSEKDLEMIENYLFNLREVAASDASEYMEISNVLPKSLLENYPMLSKFYTFKWWYHYGNDGNNVCSFNQYTLAEKSLEFEAAYCKEIKNIAHCSYMWDDLIIRHLVNDIKYLKSVYFLDAESVQLLKQEIYAFLDEMESLSIRGSFAETNNRVDLYISQINVDTNYCYYYSPMTNICGIRVFIEYFTSSENKLICDNFRKWMLAQKRVSIPISQVNERQRIEFFIQQKKVLENL